MLALHELQHRPALRGAAYQGDALLSLLRPMQSGYAPWDRTGLVAVVSDLFAYLDESGIHAGARYCAVAGYIGSPRQWSLLTDAWHQALGIVPDLSEFHAKDFFGGNSPYRDLTEEKRQALLQGLTGAVAAHRVYPFGAIVDARVFRSFSYGERRFITGGLFKGDKWVTSGAPTRPYFMCFQFCINVGAKLVKPGKRVHFIFDRQKDYAPRALETFNQIQSFLPNETAAKIGSCSFLEKGEVAALQAADMLAHCWHNGATEGSTALELDQATALRRLRAVVAQKRHQAYHTLTTRGTDNLHAFRERKDFEGWMGNLTAEQRAKLHAISGPGRNLS